MKFKNLAFPSKVYTVTDHDIREAIRREEMQPRLHHLWLSDLRKRETRSSRTSSEFYGMLIRVLLNHDHRQGGNALPERAVMYRVALHPDKPDVEVVSIGMHRVADMEPDRFYADVSKLPTWMQERLHVMIMLDDTKPTEHIEGLGRRISRYVFWLELTKGVNNHG